MSIPNDSEEKTPEELQALAEELDRQAKLASKATGRANQARAKRREVPDVPEKVLLALGGRKAGAMIVFGPEGETQLVFRPSKGRVKGAARWTVSLLPVTTSRYDTQRELNKAGRKLWDKEKGEPSVAFKAAEQLLACHVEELRALHVEVRPLCDHNERPKVRELLTHFGELLETVSHRLMRAQDAIRLVVEVLYKGLGKKMQKAFDMLRDASHWLEEVANLRFHALALANELQRPPTKKELRERCDPDERKDAAHFSRLLKTAGLSWLPGAKSPRNLR